MKLFASIGHMMNRFFGSRDTKLGRSQLVGMYLSQTNSKDAYTSEFQETRQRRNGKFATRRERA